MIKSPVALMASYVYADLLLGKTKRVARQAAALQHAHLFGAQHNSAFSCLCAYNVQTYDRKNGIVKPSMFSTHHLMVRSTPTPATKAAAYSMASSKPNSSSRRTNA